MMSGVRPRILWYGSVDKKEWCGVYHFIALVIGYQSASGGKYSCNKNPPPPPPPPPPLTVVPMPDKGTSLL